MNNNQSQVSNLPDLTALKELVNSPVWAWLKNELKQRKATALSEVLREKTDSREHRAGQAKALSDLVEYLEYQVEAEVIEETEVQDVQE